MRHLWQYLGNYKILSNCWLAIIVIAAAPRRQGGFGEWRRVWKRLFVDSEASFLHLNLIVWLGLVLAPGVRIDDPLEAQQRIQLHPPQVSSSTEVLTSTRNVTSALCHQSQNLLFPFSLLHFLFFCSLLSVPRSPISSPSFLIFEYFSWIALSFLCHMKRKLFWAWSECMMKFMNKGQGGRLGLNVEGFAC